MSNKGGKLIPVILERLEFENDFGASPIGLAYFSKDQGFIAVASLVGAFVGATFAGLPMFAVVILAGLNDINYARRKFSEGNTEENKTIEVEARGVEEEKPTTNIGQNTKLLFIEAKAKPVEEQPQVISQPVELLNAPTFDQSFVKYQPDPVDIALEMAKIPKSTIIAASPRVGKGVVVSMAIAHLRQLHPDLEIWLIDPKDEPTERHYWSLIDPDKRCHFDLRDFDVDVEAAVEVFSEHLTRFNHSPSPRKLLIIDEFVTLNQKCAGPFMNQLKDFIVGICSSGEVNPDMGIGRFVWAITQSPYVSDIGFKTKAALATFQRVFLLNKASVHLYTLAVTASFVPAGFEQKLNRLLEPTGRVFYYSRTDSWHPIPSYELPKSSTDNELREKLEGLLPKTSQRPCSHPEALGSSGSSSKISEAPEAPREEALPGWGEWRKYFPEAPEVVEEALFGAYQKALEVEGGKKKFISEILKAGTGGRKYQAASAYVDYLSKKFGSSK